MRAFWLEAIIFTVSVPPLNSVWKGDRFDKGNDGQCCSTSHASNSMADKYGEALISRTLDGFECCKSVTT